MIKRLSTIALALFLCLSFFGCADPYVVKDGYKIFTKEVFGNGITFSAAMRGGNESVAFKEMRGVMEDINNDMSLSMSSSALSEFNASAEIGFTVEIQKFTYDVIIKSIEIYKKTDGAFNIAAVNLSNLWNVNTIGLNLYGGLFPKENAPAPPKIESVKRAVENCDLTKLECFESGGKYYIKKNLPALKLDLGAIAKGFAADECVRIAQDKGIQSALINISGNLCLYGGWYRPETGQYTDWELGVTAPRPRGGLSGAVCAMKVASDCTVVTSGDYERFYTYYYDDNAAEESKQFTPLNVCHIIDTNLGMPVGLAYDAEQSRYIQQTDSVVSATVISDNSAEADAYATALCVMGYDKAVEFMCTNGLRGILFTEDKKMALVGISSDEGGVYCLVQTSDPDLDGFKDYKIEEYDLKA